MPDATKYTNKLHGARVLIIGGSSGIGYAVAEACLENQCSVVISSSSQARIDAAIASLQKSYPSLLESSQAEGAGGQHRLSGHACDLSNPSALEENVVALLEASTAAAGGKGEGKEGGQAEEKKQRKKFDHIIFTAGDKLNITGLGATSVEQIQSAAVVRFVAPQIVAKHMGAYLAAGPASSFTLTTGSVSEKPLPGWTVQNGFATGTHGLARGLALDLAPVRVNAVSPGGVDTPIWDSMGKAEKEGLMKMIAEGTCTGRIASPEDVAEAYMYLLRDHNVTGTVISTSGGSLIK